MAVINLIFGLLKGLFLVFIVLYCVFNNGTQEVIMIPNKAVYSIPGWLPSVIGLFVGIFLSVVTLMTHRIKKSKEIKELKKQIKTLKEEIDRLEENVINANESNGVSDNETD